MARSVNLFKMKRKGLNHIDTEDGIAMLKGDFASYKNCIVVVSTLKKGFGQQNYYEICLSPPRR